MSDRIYSVVKCAREPRFAGDREGELHALRERDDSLWGGSEIGRIDGFHPAGSGHHPRTVFRVMHSGDALFVRFDVEDRFVRSVHTEPQSHVCADSCVEFFVRPADAPGYFNFEMNAGGALHASYVTNPERLPQGGLKERKFVPGGLMGQIEVAHTLPRVVEPEIPEPTIWRVACKIPLSVMSECCGVDCSLAGGGGKDWRGNFFKCGDGTSHPHWGFWNDIGEELNYHQPAKFGVLRMMP